MPRIKIVPSTAKGKKWTALIKYNDDQTKPIVKHFGAKGYDDYTIGATDQQRKNYRSRHQKEANQKFDTPGALSYHILWGDSKSRAKNISAYKTKYNLKSF